MCFRYRTFTISNISFDIVRPAHDIGVPRFQMSLSLSRGRLSGQRPEWTLSDHTVTSLGITDHDDHHDASHYGPGPSRPAWGSCGAMAMGSDSGSEQTGICRALQVPSRSLAASFVLTPSRKTRNTHWQAWIMSICGYVTVYVRLSGLGFEMISGFQNFVLFKFRWLLGNLNNKLSWSSCAG